MPGRRRRGHHSRRALRETNLQFRDDKGNDVVLDAERRFLAPDRIWTQLTDKATGTVTQSGYDGKFPWFYGAPKGVRRLDGPDNANDLKQLTSDVEITSALARALLLARLQRELKDLKRLDDATRGDAKLLVVEGDAQVDMNQKKTPTRLRLQVAEKDAQLLGVRVVFRARPAADVVSRHEVASASVPTRSKSSARAPRSRSSRSSSRPRPRPHLRTPTSPRQIGRGWMCGCT
jgi:hypothetical protein